MTGTQPIRPVYFAGGALHLLDQRLLPGEVREVVLTEPVEVARAIRDLVVRGAPAIGIAAAFGMALAVERGTPLREAAAVLKAARPTAVNLAWAVDRMRDMPPARILEEAQRVLDEDIASCKAIGRHGAALIPDGATVLTHCNAGALATGGYGTALGVIRGAIAQGKRVKVLACETRPFLQGARLTAWELQRDGIPVELLTDGMSGHYLSRGEIACAVVGADRIARNGDTANKIGTLTHAVLCKEYGVPFYVAAPRSTFDPALADGAGIPIEERSAEEVTRLNGSLLAPDGVRARHPAFDVTPRRYITAFITEHGVEQ